MPSPRSRATASALERVTQRTRPSWAALTRKASWHPAQPSRSALLSSSRSLGMAPPVPGKEHVEPSFSPHQEPNWPSWLRSQLWRCHGIPEFMSGRSQSWGAGWGAGALHRLPAPASAFIGPLRHMVIPIGIQADPSCWLISTSRSRGLSSSNYADFKLKNSRAGCF